MRGIEGKTAIVTGAATGIGRATAERFAAEGANVAVTDVNVDAGKETVDAIEAAGGNAIFIETDVTDTSQVNAMVEQTVETFGALHFAHNNAGIAYGAIPFEEVDAETWDRINDVNQRAVWRCMQAELPHIREAGGGAIINTASMAGLWAANQRAAYVTSKHGVVGMTKSVALEYARENIRANALCPGLTRTPLTEGRLEPGREVTAMDRAADPAEIAAMAVWLASEESSFVTGVALPVDGGSLNGRP